MAPTIGRGRPPAGGGARRGRPAPAGRRARRRSATRLDDREVLGAGNTSCGRRCRSWRAPSRLVASPVAVAGEKAAGERAPRHHADPLVAGRAAASPAPPRDRAGCSGSASRRTASSRAGRRGDSDLANCQAYIDWRRRGSAPCRRAPGRSSASSVSSIGVSLVEAVDLVEVDVVDPQAPQAGVDRALQDVLARQAARRSARRPSGRRPWWRSPPRRAAPNSRSARPVTSSLRADASTCRRCRRS